MKQMMCPTLLHNAKKVKESNNSNSGMELVFLMIYHLSCGAWRLTDGSANPFSGTH